MESTKQVITYPQGVESPEHRLLFCCARRYWNETIRAEARALVRAEMDWAKVWELARQHKLLAFLHLHLESVGEEPIPEAFKAQLGAQYVHQSKRSLVLVSELARLNRSMVSQGLCPLAYKGPVLSHLAYGKVAMRPCSDLDILVRPEDVATAQQCLLASGYITGQDLNFSQSATPAGSPPRKNGWARFLTYENSFMKQPGDYLVELHWSLAAHQYALDLETSDLWRRRVPSELNPAISTLHPDDLLLALAIHAARNEWICLEWVVSIAELVAVPKTDSEWQHIIERARQAKTRRILWLALLLAQDLAALVPGTFVLPAWVEREMNADKTARALRNWVWSRLFLARPVPEARRSWQGRRFLIRVREHWSSRLLYIARDLAAHYFLWIDATYREAEQKRLPHWRWPLFLAVRLVTGARKALVRNGFNS